MSALVVEAGRSGATSPAPSDQRRSSQSQSASWLARDSTAVRQSSQGQGQKYKSTQIQAPAGTSVASDIIAVFFVRG